MTMRPYSKKTVKISRERMYDIIQKPRVTEKSTRGGGNGQVTFVVPLDATKPEIQVAVETLFSRRVKAVNTIRVKGKVKRFRGRPGKQSDFKKAIVTFEEGQDIDISQGV